MYLVDVFFFLALAQNPDSGGCRLQIFGRLFTMVSTHWDTSIIDEALFEPKWSTTTIGTTVDVVVQVHCFGEDMSLATLVPSGCSCQIRGSLSAVNGPGRFTLFQAVVSSTDPLLLQIGSPTVVRAHLLPSASSILSLVEVCAGLGGSSVGLEFAGFKLRAAMEWMPRLADLHQIMHPGVPVVVGDIGLSSALQTLHEVCPEPFTLMAGVSCQPYSRAGRAGGSSDPRSNTVPATCRICHLFQVPVLIMECVVPARSNLFVQQHLHALEKLGYRVVDCVLQLEQEWAAHRLRWWVVACHPQLAITELPVFPGGSNMTVRDLMPYVRDWPVDDLAQLTLTREEEGEFMQYSNQNLRKFGVNLNSKLPTALHSWGNQVVSCACGCRDRLSTSFLKEKGLFAQLLPLREHSDGSTCWRHMHPMEVAMLNGMPPLQRWSTDQRLNLCAIGQVASPLQAVWVGSVIIHQLQCALGISAPLDPKQCLHNLKQLVFQQSQSLYPPLPKPVTTTTCVLFWKNSLAPVTIQVGPSVTIGCLRAAEATLQNSDGTIWTFVDEATSEELPDDACVAGRTLQVGPVTRTSVPPSEVPLPDVEMDSPQPVTPAFRPCNLETRFAAVADVPLPPQESLPSSGSTVSVAPTLQQSNPCLALRDALLTLPAKSLLCLQPPLVHDLQMCETLLVQAMTVKDRLAVLANRQSVCSDDELRWHLGRLQPSFAPSGTTVLDPLLVHGWMQQPNVQSVQHWLAQAPATQCIVTCLLHQGHWTPAIWTDKVSHLEAKFWEHPSIDLSLFEPLNQLLCHCMKLPTVQVVVTPRPFTPSHLCGAASIAFIESTLCQQQLPTKESHLQSFHDNCRALFHTHLQALETVPRPWCWGAGSFDVAGTLSTLLIQHGVPPSAADARSKLLIQSLGKSEVERALQGVAPWKTLKALANQHTPVVQLVLQDEVINKSKGTKGGGKQKKGQGKGGLSKPAIRPADLDPSKLILEPGTFCCRDDQPLSQIPLTQVGPLASGVAITTFTEAQTFLKTGNLLTHQSLALLILDATAEPQTTLQWSSIRFAAKCALNHEPMLLTGFLVQLGKEPAFQFRATSHIPLKQIEVACARITVYQDQWEGPWEEFQSKPVKACLHFLKPLQTCHNSSCSCIAWHPGDEETHDAVLDVFRRQYFTEAGRPTKGDQADYFAFTLRYIKKQERSLLEQSGVQGIYVEPKTEDAAAPHSDFQVVWMPQLSQAEVKHRAQCEALSIGVARNGRRFGVRVASTHFQQVFQALKPEALFLAPGPRITWHCGPWPYGVDRKALATVFRQWKWDARPLQPVQAVSGGMMWAVQAIADPPQVVYAMNHGQVVISRKTVEDPSTALPPAEVIGQSKTVQLCTSDKTTKPDPWTLNDPWQSTLPSEVSSAGALQAKAQLEDLEQRLEKNILARLPANMEIDGQEQRLQQLEHQVSTLVARQQSLEVVVQDNQTQCTAQVQQLQVQMSAQMDLQGRRMQSMFDDQMSKLEAILAKKGRYE